MEDVRVAVHFCEQAFRSERDNCLESGIYPIWPPVVARLMERRHELTYAYLDIYQKLDGDARAGEIFADAIMCAISVWTPDSIAEARTAKSRLGLLTSEISDKAGELATLLQEHDDLQNHHSIGSNTHYHIVSVIEAAGDARFGSWVRDDLCALRRKFDLKYWPSLPDVVAEISTNFAEGNVAVYNEITQAALHSTRPSKADFVRALFARVAACSDASGNIFPSEFKLRDETWASLVNCLLDLDADGLIDGAYIKRLRQRDRNEQPHGSASVG